MLASSSDSAARRASPGMTISLEIEPAREPYYRASENAWIITRYEDASRVLRAPNVSVATGPTALIARVSERLGGAFDDLAALVSGLPLFLSPPEHGRSRSFLHEIVRAMMSAYSLTTIDVAISRLVEELDPSAEIDGMSTLCQGLTDSLFSAAYGHSRVDLREMRHAGNLILDDWRPAMPVSEYERRQELARDVRERIKTGWRNHGCPVLGDAAHLAEARAAISERDRDGAMFFLAFVANDTMAAFLGNLLSLLAIRRDLQDSLRRPSGLTPGFVEEALRYCGPVRYRSRVVGRGALEIGEAMLQEGALAHVRLESANRDPMAYPEPNDFDPERRGPPPLAFGAGSHICVGAIFARRLTKRFLHVLLDRYEICPGSSPARLSPSRDLRRFDVLPLRLRPI